MYLWTAFLIGLVGSAHCVGMCGPIVLSLRQGRGFSAFVHHSGRILTYMALGGVAGGIGHSFSVMGVQQIFSITLGTLMIALVILWPVKRFSQKIESFIGHLSIRLHRWTHSAALSPAVVRLLTGAANGILPCGLVYLGVAGAANTYTPWDGALFMLAFGVGTLPALMVVLHFGRLLNVSLRSHLRKLVPVTVFLLGLLLIVRGCNLGIPYLSPEKATSNAASCE